MKNEHNVNQQDVGIRKFASVADDDVEDLPVRCRPCVWRGGVPVLVRYENALDRLRAGHFFQSGPFLLVRGRDGRSGRQKDLENIGAETERAKSE